MYLLKMGSRVGVCFILKAGVRLSERIDVFSEVDLLIESKYVNKSNDYPGDLFCIFDYAGKEIMTTASRTHTSRVFIYSRRENWMKLT